MASAGVFATTSMYWSFSFSRISGSARICAISSCRRRTIASGVFAGTMKPIQASAWMPVEAALRERRQIGQRRRALRGGDGERLELAGLDVRHDGGRGQHGDVGVARQQRRRRQGRSRHTARARRWCRSSRPAPPSPGARCCRRPSTSSCTCPGSSSSARPARRSLLTPSVAGTTSTLGCVAAMVTELEVACESYGIFLNSSVLTPSGPAMLTPMVWPSGAALATASVPSCRRRRPCSRRPSAGRCAWRAARRRCGR